MQKRREKNKEVSYALIRRHFKLRLSDTTLKKRIMKPMDYTYRLRARKPAVPAGRAGAGGTRVTDSTERPELAKLYL